MAMLPVRRHLPRQKTRRLAAHLDGIGIGIGRVVGERLAQGLALLVRVVQAVLGEVLHLEWAIFLMWIYFVFFYLKCFFFGSKNVSFLARKFLNWHRKWSKKKICDTNPQVVVVKRGKNEEILKKV